MTALRTYTSAERKEMPLWSLMAQYFPDALMAVARHSKKANDKHNPGEPMHWARHKSGDHLECAARHLLTPYEVDADTGEIELVGALWRCAAALQLHEEERLTEAGIRPLSGVTPLKYLHPLTNVAHRVFLGEDDECLCPDCRSRR